MKRLLFFSIALGILFATPSFASHQPKTNRLIFLDAQTSIDITSQNPVGGFSLAAGDLGTDGTPELVIGNGLGTEPRVRVLRLDGSEIGSFLAYHPSIGVGVNVAVCDLNGDTLTEIITAPQRGGGPHIRLFDRMGTPFSQDVFAYEESFRGGVTIACGDLFGDERAELVTLPGVGGGPHVRIWNFENDTLTLVKQFFAFDPNDRSGLTGIISDHKLYIAQQKNDTPKMQTISFVSDEMITNETQISVESTGIDALVIHNNQRLVSTANGKIVNVDTGETKTISSSHQSFALASVDTQLLAMETREAFADTDATEIIVDLSEQRLYAYKDGMLENSFLISSGKNNATPVGNHQILAKIPKVHYRWVYGPNDPRNYDLGLVPYNLRFAPHIYLHYAYWHNNFGHPMSRGCVNVSFEQMKWLYDWAGVGIPVNVVN